MEHYQRFNTVWRGEHGRVVLYQNEQYTVTLSYKQAIIMTTTALLLQRGYLARRRFATGARTAPPEIRTGRGLRAPVCVDLQTYPAKAEGGRVLVDLG